MSYVNTENEAYQKLNNWQKWLVHFSQNALTRFIYQLILLTDLAGLINVIIKSFKIKSISTINYNPIVLPIGLMCLFIIQFGWLFSWYAMVNHEKRRQTYFKWIYSWLALTTLLIATSIVLYFSTISFNNKLVYTNFCFFISWFGYELLVLALHIKDQIEILPLIEISKGQFASEASSYYKCDRYDKYDKYDKFYVRSCRPITVNNNINCLFHKHFTDDDCIVYNNKYSISTFSNQDLIAKDESLFCFSDVHSLETDWSDVKYRNHNQHDTFLERMSHQSHLFFNGKNAHQTYTIILSIILFSYLVNLCLMIINPIVNFIKLPVMYIGNLITKIDFSAIGYSLGILIVTIFIICIVVFEYAYLRKQK